jgi:hypothetical protein
MDEIEYEDFQEKATYGEWLIKTIADNIGIAPDPEQIDRAIYKGTDCGAWVRFDEDGIMIGTIVEGSDAEYRERIECTECEETLCENFWEAIQRAEDFSAEEWRMVDDEEEDDDM